MERDGVRYVENTAAQAQLEVQGADAAVEATWLVFWGDQAVARDASGYHFAANTENHEVLMFDAELSFTGALLPQGPDGDRLQRPQLIAAGSGERLAAFEAAGTVLLFDRWGREFVRLETPFAYAVGAWGPDGRLTLARSPFNVGFSFEGEDPPLVVRLDPARPDAASGLGRAHEALSAFYIHATNAGTVALDDQGNIYFAALGRAEVEKLDPYGETLWVSRRPAGFDTPEPRLVQNPDGPARLLLSSVQKASAIGPDGLLYVRAAANEPGEYDRLDVLDPETGGWLRSAPLDTGTAVLVGSRGAVWEAPRGALLVERTRERREFPSFALETFEGDSLRLEELRGKVVLVSFWASWCAPCREELPLLDSLNAAIQRPDFALIGIAEDVNEEDARAFADEIGLQMPSVLGHGRMRQRYHYSGLPYSVLLDREGRIIKEYYGFGGRQAFDREVAGRVLAALGEPAGVTESVAPPSADPGPLRDQLPDTTT